LDYYDLLFPHYAKLLYHYSLIACAYFVILTSINYKIVLLLFITRNFILTSFFYFLKYLFFILGLYHSSINTTVNHFQNSSDLKTPFLKIFNYLTFTTSTATIIHKVFSILLLFIIPFISFLPLTSF
jgi:hypothetical protein